LKTQILYCPTSSFSSGFRLKTCGAKQPFFWQTSLKKRLNCAAGIAAVQRALTLIVLCALALSAAGCAASPLPGKGRVVDKDGKPMAGVHTLAWRTSTSKALSFTSSNFECNAQHYALSDANGEFIIPGSVIRRPWFVSISTLSVTAFAPGMKPEVEVMSGERKRVPGQDFDFDFDPTPEKPLVIEVRLMEDLREETERSREVFSKAQNQGCFCTDLNRAYIAEWVRLRDKLHQAERLAGNYGRGGEHYFANCRLKINEYK
jgi:hypothetical protein